MTSRWMTLLVLPALLLGACGKSEESKTSKGAAQSEVILAGSTSVQPFADYLSEEYRKAHPDLVITVQGGGSSAGIKAVHDGACNIGMSSREVKESEADGLKVFVIARDGIAMIVHPSNPISNLKLTQICGMFDGTIKNWSEVGGKKGAIRAITREAGSGTRGAFQELVMKKQRIARTCLVQNTNGAVRQLVSLDPQAIGYISLGLVDSTVKAVDIEGVPAKASEVVAGKYKLVRPFLFMTKGEPTPSAADFIAFVLGDKGQGLLESEHLIRAK